MTIGENIRAIRKEKGLTQKELGRLCGIAEITIRQYESEKYQPKIETIEKIAKALGVPIVKIKEDLTWAEHQNTEEITVLSDEVARLQVFECYLKSLGYSVSYEGPDDSDNPDVVLTKGKEKTTFTGGQFEQFEKAISDSVEYQVWLQNSKKQ